MHNNYYFLKDLVPSIKSKISGLQLLECFSQNKDELVLIFGDAQNEFVIKASLDNFLLAITFPSSFSRAKKNSVDLFKDIIDQEINNVVVVQNDRSFYIEFKNELILLFQLYGRKGNIYLLKEDTVVHSFRSQGVVPESISVHNLDRKLKQTMQAFVENGGDYYALFPTFGPLVKGWLNENSYESLDIEGQWTLISGMLKQLRAHEYFIISYNDKPHLSLIPIGEIIESFSDPILAINSFATYYRKSVGFESSQKLIVEKIERQILKTEKYIKSIQLRLEQLESETPLNQIADILMANLHNIGPGVTSVELLNFYNNSTIKIALKKDLTPQKNAENYYRKSKNQGVELDQLKATIQSKKDEIKSLKSDLEQVQKSTSGKDLKSFEKENTNSSSKKSQKDELFKIFEIDGFKILVGRNSKNNDLLTQQYAHKDDLWLHAKDVSGSHVVIKYNSGKPFSKYVKEQAASIAAYFSKRKTDSLCPVIITPKKFVRKPKGSLPGQVIVDREDVILVEPGLPN